MARSPLPRASRAFYLSNPEWELDAPLANPHGLGLHQPEGSGVAILGPDSRHGIECIAQPLPFSGHLFFPCLQLCHALHVHTLPVWPMFSICS
jgi:hypothetical protein